MSTNLVTGKSKNRRHLNDVINCMFDKLQGTSVKDENEEFINTICAAKQEMVDAQCYFDNVTAPELVDYAIYKMEAAKSQYAYLLKLAKDKELNVTI